MKERKTKHYWIRLSPEDEAMFKRKAAHYQSVSAMARDAVKQFDDTTTIGKLDALNKMTAFYVKFQQDLSWLGGNFNQAMKRANELANSQELTPQFFEQVLCPQLEEIMELLSSIKRSQDDMAKQVTRL